MSALPTLQQVKQDLAKESGYASWKGYKDCWRGFIPDQAIEAISIEFTRRVLDYVAENVKLKLHEFPNGSHDHTLDKESILKIKDQLQ